MKKNLIQGIVALACLVGPVNGSAQQVVLPESSREVQTDAGTRARMHMELSALYFQGGVPAVALEEASIAIDIDPSYALAYNMRALVYVSLRDFNSADADFRKALSLAPSDPEISNNYGWYLCLHKALPQEAMPHFQIAIQNPLYRTPDIALLNAGLCAMKSGDLAGARDYLTKTLVMGRESAPSAQLQLAKLAYMEGNAQEARNRLTEIMQQTGTLSSEALWLAIRVEHRLGNSAEEASLIAQLRRIYPNSTEYQELLRGNCD